MSTVSDLVREGVGSTSAVSECVAETECVSVLVDSAVSVAGTGSVGVVCSVPLAVADTVASFDAVGGGRYVSVADSRSETEDETSALGDAEGDPALSGSDSVCDGATVCEVSLEFDALTVSEGAAEGLPWDTRGVSEAEGVA